MTFIMRNYYRNTFKGSCEQVDYRCPYEVLRGCQFINYNYSY